MNDRSARNPIDVLADEFVQRYRQGERPTIEQFARQHPEFADDIRNLFPMLVNIEQLKRPAATADGTRVALPAASIEQLGDFRIIREIGRGGMGVVFEAEQQSLGRRVALKVLGHNVAGSPNRVQRFRREAEAAARLHHTNIVPVYGVGQENDLHFYAMQFIDGVGLDVVLRVLCGPSPRADTLAGNLDDTGTHPDSSSVAAAINAANALRDGSFSQAKKPGNGNSGTRARQAEIEAGNEDLTGAADPCVWPTPVPLNIHYWRSIARLGADVADALGYAHAHGILHRDVKPSNLLLDREGNVWISDFGLAKQLESDNLTSTGDIVGTLRYMAPEQFNGSADHRSDIYSLGLTLHELLTLQPAFDESQQGRLIHQKTQGAAPRLRSRNAAIPADLETIVLKACATDPAHRYPSASELAADLHRFLEERPISARRTGIGERMWRWCRRNPAMALSSGTAIALLILVAVVAVVGNVNTTAALRAAERAKGEAVDARQRAEDNLNLAIEAFESIFENIATRGVPQSLELEYEDDAAPRFESVLTDADAELLNRLLTFYEQFARQNHSDLQLRAKTAAAHHRIGQIHQRLGHFEEASKSYRDAQAIYESLLDNQPQQVDLVIAKARLLNDQGILLSTNMQPFDEVIQRHLQAVKFLSSQTPAVASLAKVRYELARSHDLAGSVVSRNRFADLSLAGTGGPPGPLAPGPPGPIPNNPLSPGPPRKTAESLGENPLPWPKPPRGRGPFGAGPAAGKQRPRRGPLTPGLLRGGPESGPPLGGALGAQFDWGALNEKQLQQAHDILTTLIAEDADNPEYRLLQAQVERHRLVHSLLRHSSEDAGAAFHAARGILEQLVADFPQEPQYRMELADTLSLVSTRLTSISDSSAEEYLKQAIETCLPLAKSFPNQPQYQALLATSYRNLARVQQTRQNLADADRNFQFAKERLELLVTRDPGHAFYKVGLAFAAIDLAEVKMARGAAEKSVAYAAEARDILSSAIARLAADRDDRDNPFLRRVTATMYHSLARSLTSLGDIAAAGQALRQAERFSDNPFRPPFGRFLRGFGPPPKNGPPQP